MLHKFFGSVRSAVQSSGIEVYYNGLLKEGGSGGPSLAEARQDYWRFTRSKNEDWYAMRTS